MFLRALGLSRAEVTVLLRSSAWGSSVPRKMSGMKSLSHAGIVLTKRCISTALIGLFVCSASLTHASDQSGFQLNPNAGSGDVIVHGKLGGLIFGFEVDPDGTEGLLCEAVSNPDGTVSARVETFSQATGRIIRVLAGSESQDDTDQLETNRQPSETRPGRHAECRRLCPQR